MPRKGKPLFTIFASFSLFFSPAWILSKHVPKELNTVTCKEMGELAERMSTNDKSVARNPQQQCFLLLSILLDA